MKYMLLPALCALLLSGAGCNQATRHTPSLEAPTVPAPEYPQEAYRKNNPGSLFAASEEEPLFSDARARRVGDLVVIKLVENTKAKNKADTSASKGNTNDVGVGALFGNAAAGFIPMVNLGPRGNTSTSATNSQIFASNSASDVNVKGETKRENYVTTSLAARVTKVLPGGVLQVQGAREIRVNEETEYMVVSGLIRSKDVAADNSVLSNQMAEASIQYYGKGVLADKQKPGWFTRLMDNVWPY